MKPVLTPEQAAQLDRETQAKGVPAEVLMERAGRAVAHAAAELAGGVYGRRAVVVCGTGNNGGDGLVAARHLARWGMRVAVLAVAPLDELREPSATNLARLGEQRLDVRSGSEDRLERELARADVAVDAIFGTGFHGDPRGAWAAAIEALNGASTPVVAVDIPSGVDGATGAVGADAVWAELTVTFGAAKVGVVLLPGAERAGTVRVVDIGFPDELVRAEVGLIEPDDVESVLPRRSPEGHKRSTGVLLVIAGSRAMTGAPALIARAAGRAGAGLVTVATPLDALSAVRSHAMEAVFLPLAQTDDGTVAIEALDPLLEALGRADAVAIGPGLTRNEETSRLVRDVVRLSPVPVVLDADGLNAFAGDAGALRERSAAAVLTPHDGEYSRLMDVDADATASDRIGAARRLVSTTGAVVLLKGSRTLISGPDGETRVNPTGSAVLATAGTGDVLTGVIGGLLARGLDPLDAASAGAYTHGLAGLLAGRSLGEGTLAGDVAERLPEAIGLVGGPAT
ncbi:MAG: NAD(P)H-hydrate dehydratase [Actinomycetota bacterium]